MRNRNFRHILSIVLTVLLIVSICSLPSSAEDEKYYLGTLVNAGKDTGFSEINAIEEGDVHWGWKLGSFHISGYTRVTNTDSDNPVFLKNVGDTVSLWFILEQNLDCLNNNEKLSVCSDPNGSDKYFDIPETNFGRGALIIRHTDYQNKTHDPVIYTDYLSANATQGADVQVQLFEEGDYEVALNYEIKDSAFINMFSSYENYRIFFKFSVRNGNCMVFPFDVSTGAELTNSALTENGFRLDLAKSRYLDIDIKKENLNEGAEGLVEDTRFNRPAKDGDSFTDEGIYTITVKNKYTGQETVKKIYVGTNSILKAHAVTGLSIAEINALVANGATIGEDGKILGIDASDSESGPSANTSSGNGGESSDDEANGESNGGESEGSPMRILPIILCSATLIILVAIFVKKRKSVSKNNEREE